ncbi:hypothetical protein QTP88_027623 [Uroleucon formosanum]
MESPSLTKVQTPPFYVSEGYEFSTLKNALFDINESSSILFKSTPKYLIIYAGTVVAWNTIFKFLADNEQFKFHTHLPKPLKPYSVFIRHLHPSTPVENIQPYITDKGYEVIQLHHQEVAATFLHGGKTTHSAFKLPLNLNTIEIPTCNINKQSNMANVLKKCKLIVWNESPMSHKKGFEALNNSLKDLRNSNLLMGGVTVLLARDFRQTLPIVPRGT